MKKIYTCIVLLFFWTSCSKQIDDGSITTPQKSQTAKNDRIYIDEALDQWYGAAKNGAERKALGNKKIAKIDSIYTYDPKVLNRKSIPNENDVVLFTVHFEGGGYAVLSADSRIPSPLIAFAEEGSINAADFYQDITKIKIDQDGELDDFSLYNVAEDDYYAGSTPEIVGFLIKNYAKQFVDEHLPHAGEDGGGVGIPSLPIITGDWVYVDGIEPMLKTKWHQKSPFNDECPMKGIFNKKRAPAGCVPIAIAQIMAYNEVPRTMSWNGYSCSWAELRSIVPSATPGSSREAYIRKTAAFFLSNIGAHCNTVYSKEWGFTLPARAKNFLANYYRKVEIFKNNYREDKILEMLQANKPVFIAAVSGVVNGHAWVIDGMEVCSREKYTLDPITQQKKLVETENEIRVNCNWGW